jgi:Ion channel
MSSCSLAKHHIPFHIGRHRLSVAHLVAALVVLFVFLPFADYFNYGDYIEAVLLTAVLLAAVNAVGGRRRTQAAAAVLVIPVIVTHWLDHLWPGMIPLEPVLLAEFAFVSFVIVHLFRYVMTSPAVNSEVICAAVAVYLLFAVACAFLYTLLGNTFHNAFVFTVPDSTGSKMCGFTALYYSIETLTAANFGDILPAMKITRMLALSEATVGMFYMTILLARLVGVYSAKKPSA